MYFKVYLQLAYFSFSFTLSSNKDNMLIFDANTYYEALDMVQKSQQLYTSDSVLGRWLTEKATFLPKCQARFLSVLCTERPVHTMFSLSGHKCSRIFQDSLLWFPTHAKAVLQSTTEAGKMGNEVWVEAITQQPLQLSWWKQFLSACVSVVHLFCCSLPCTAGTHPEHFTAFQSCCCEVKYVDCWLGSEDPKQNPVNIPSGSASQTGGKENSCGPAVGSPMRGKDL